MRALLPRSVVVVLLGALASGVAVAQPAAGARIPTVTRLVKQFYEFETTLDARVAARDVAAVDALLDANFEARRGAMPGVPIPRDEWLRDAATASAPAKIGQIAVHDFGSVAVVSFMQIDGGPQSSTAPKERMIVDCWTRSSDRWQLTVRYEGAPAPARSASRGDKRPSGRQ